MSKDVPNSVKEARERFDLYSDASLASRLQDQEFGAHFHANRQERRLVGSDTKMSREEQLAEMQRQDALRKAHLTEVAETDEEIARRMQEEFDREDEVKRFIAMKQAEEDERVARALQNEEATSGHGTSLPSSSSQAAAITLRRSTDPHYAADNNNLNEHYAIRTTSSHIDLSAEDALNTIPTPTAFSACSTASRDDAYAPLDTVPLLPPPPEFVLMREQQQQQLESELRNGITLDQAAAAQPVAALPTITLTTPTPIDLMHLAPTNPFLVDVISEARERRATIAADYDSEFGFPPPSDLALGLNNNYTSTQ